MLNIPIPFRRIGANGPLLLMLLRNDIKAKFRHSILGVLWLFIPPLLILLVYVYMFSFVFKMRWPDTNCASSWGGGLFIYAGITVYSAFSDSIMGSLNLLSSRAAMLKRFPFPLELLPVSLTMTNILISGMVLWIIFFLSLASGGRGSWTAVLYFPLIWLPYALLVTGIAWITSALGVFFRDLGNLFGVLLLLCFFASPILYSDQMIPEQIAWLNRWNPLSPIIGNIRGIFLQNSAPDGWGLLGSWLLGLVLFQGGFCFFQRMRRRFADVV